MILTERGVEMKMYGGDKTGGQILYSQATRPCKGKWGVSQADGSLKHIPVFHTTHCSNVMWLSTRVYAHVTVKQEIQFAIPKK